MKVYCVDETQTEVMKNGLRDVGKWVYYILKSARTANIPWYVLKEGIYKAGAYEAYSLYPRTGDRKELAEAFAASDMGKAYGCRILSVDKNQISIEFTCSPMMEMARTCTEDAVFLEELQEAYRSFFEGIFATYGYCCKWEESSQVSIWKKK